jgi:broad specificity phosphatase PhoE
MRRVLYITHPQVLIEPSTPASQWHLSEHGRTRATAFGRSARMLGVRVLIASREIKAQETAQMIGRTTEAEIETGRDLHEADRTATGFVDEERFVGLLAAFYAEPRRGPEGWESGQTAQARIVRAVKAELDLSPSDLDIAFVGHGTVGTLLKCALAGRPIAAAEDQRQMADPGGGNLFGFDADSWTLLNDWVSMEAFAAGFDGGPERP